MACVLGRRSSGISSCRAVPRFVSSIHPAIQVSSPLSGLPVSGLADPTLQPCGCLRHRPRPYFLSLLSGLVARRCREGPGRHLPAGVDVKLPLRQIARCSLEAVTDYLTDAFFLAGRKEAPAPPLESDRQPRRRRRRAANDGDDDHMADTRRSRRSWRHEAEATARRCVSWCPFCRRTSPPSRHGLRRDFFSPLLSFHLQVHCTTVLPCFQLCLCLFCPLTLARGTEGPDM